MALSATDVKTAKYEPTRKRLYDTGGLYLELAPSGGKWWRFKYRFEGKEKLLSLGIFPDVPLAGRWLDKAKQLAKDPSGYLKGARDKRDEARELVAAGIDPSMDRKAEAIAKKNAAVNTFEAVAREWLAHMSGGWKAGTLEAITASLENHVFPTIGARNSNDIKPADIRNVVKAVEADGARDAALRVFQRIKAVYRYAISHDKATTDPTYPLKPAEIFRPHAVTHRRSLPEREMPGFLHKLAVYDGDAATRAALELLILTAVRPGELRGARWDEIDVRKSLWRIPAGRMKLPREHLVPLSRQALELVQSIRAGSGGGDLLFPSPYYPGKPLSDGTLNSALARMGYKAQATAHGFRTLFSTCANEHGWNGDLIEKQLAHEERDDVRAAYNRAQHLAERTKLMQWWADRVDELRRGADVIPIRA